MKSLLPLFLFLFPGFILEAQVKEITPIQSKQPTLEDPIYTKKDHKWIEIYLKDVRELLSPEIIEHKFPEIGPLLDEPKWLVKIVSTENNETYFIDAHGRSTLIEKDYSTEIEALKSDVDALKVELLAPEKSTKEGLSIAKFQNDTLFFTNGTHLVLPQPEATATIQQLAIDGLTLSITDGNSIDLGAILALECCSDNQTLELSGSLLSIFGGNSVDLSQLDEDSDPNNEIQELYLDGNKLSISNGNTVLLPFLDDFPNGNNQNPENGLNESCNLALIPDYETLRANPPEDTLVFIYAPGISGFFQRVEDGIEDGGTLIESPVQGGGIFWKRVRPEGFFKLDWWRIGDYIPNSAVGDTVRSAADILNMIMVSSEGGAIIDVSNDQSPRTIILDKSVDLWGDVIIKGAGDTFKRQDATWTVLTADVGANDQDLPVESSEGFFKGQTVLVTSGNAFGENNSKGKLLKEIDDPNVLPIQGGLGGAMSAGDTVTTAFTMFKGASSAPLPLRRLAFQDVNFDGNWPKNTFTNDWRFNNTFTITSNAGTRLIIENAYFRRTPSENIVAGNMAIRDVEADSLAGSLVHISTSLDTSIGVLVENVRAKDVNIMTNAVMGHSEGFIVSSASPQNIKVHKVTAFNGQEPFVGDLGAGTDYWEVKDCRVEDFKYVTVGNFSGSNKKLEGIQFINNQFYNCNQLVIEGGRLGNQRYLDHPRIDGNLFVNTTLQLEGVIGASINNNQFVYDASRGGYSNLDEELTDIPFDAMVYVSEFQDLQFSGNLMIGDPLPNDTIKQAVVFDNSGTIDNSISQFYYLGYGLRCSNNQIYHFQRGITYEALDEDPSGLTDPIIRAYHDFSIDNNSIWMNENPASFSSWGIIAGPGVNVQHNRIYANSEPCDNCYPMYLYGVAEQLRDRILGPVAQYNQIYGKLDPNGDNHSIYLGVTINSTPTSFSNAIIRENILFAPIETGAPDQGDLIINQNTILTSQLQFLDDYQAPPAIRFGEF